MQKLLFGEHVLWRGVVARCGGAVWVGASGVQAGRSFGPLLRLLDRPPAAQA